MINPFKIAAAVLIVAATPALAEADVQAAPVATNAETPFDAAASISGDELGAISGQANVNMEVRANNSSNVSNNSVNGNSVTGAIGFDSQAFQNLSGFAVVSANTGNNVAINSSLNVNVALNP